MFVKFSQLITQAGLSGINVRIEPSNEGRLRVVLLANAGTSEVKNDALRGALMRGLHLEGNVLDIEEDFWPHFDKFMTSNVQTATYANTQDVLKGNAADIEKANASASTKAATDTPNAAAILREQVEVENETNVQVNIDDVQQGWE